MILPRSLDFHMHSRVSDGTDAPEELLCRVREAGIEAFSLTDHDAVKGCLAVRKALGPGDPLFLNGAEFSCKDEEGQYHVLGYGYPSDSPAILALVEKGHAFRLNKLKKRMDFLAAEFGFTFSREDTDALFALDNPGKPHLGNLMVRYGYASSKEEAIGTYIDRYHAGSEYVRPEEAIRAILAAGGIPILAHPAYGRGDDLILGEALERRLKRLMEFGLQGLEAFYSGFSPKIVGESLSLAEKYRLFVTAGSDYHGKNKLVRLGDTNLPAPEEFPDGLKRFLETVFSL